MTTGIIGLGLMGMALAERLLDAGQRVVGLDVDPARGAVLAAKGGAIADDLDMVTRSCATVLVAVYDAGQTEQVLLGHGGIADARRSIDIICITTCPPDQMADFAARLTAAGHGLVEFPISGTSAQLRRGEAIGLVAGDATARKRTAPLLALLCPERLEFGPAGDAARTKLAINLVLQLNRAALAEGLAYATALGLDAGAFLAALQRSAAASQVMAGKGPKMIARDYAPESHLAQTLKDAEMILQTALVAGQALPLMLVQRALLRDAITTVGEAADSAAIIEAIRPCQGMP
ncbi:NAD(P)-dependent oxidoreductase [Roseomonas hellenica]|uniref:NAD(P)-dependent oxidoreductase n=1 Tax=Plastoroseomonas hellenica TaxID=2687306 RepID=A0ABS5ERL6_9PROT|nr:NAD(P)-dependent oxidoreductase [Plastoroseomonas hellenica]